jgi:hypothetical protein
MVDGGRGLSPATTLTWGYRRFIARNGAQPAAAQNSSFTWAAADDQRTTLAWLHNYWSDAYQIDRPVIDVQLLASSGAVLKDWSVTMEPDSTLVFDVRHICREAAVPLPFEGELLLRTSHPKLFAGRPLQVFAEYVNDDGEASGVHGQYGLMTIPAAQVVGNMRAEAGHGSRTAVLVTNAYAGPGGPRAMRPKLIMLDAEGRKRTKHLEPVPPFGTTRVYLDSAFPQLEGFLGGRPGHFHIKLPCPSSRVATFIDYADGRRVVNHGTIDRIFDQGSGMPAAWTRSLPIASSLVVCGEDRDTVLSFSNNWGPLASDYEVTVRVSGEDGRELARRAVVVRRLAFEHMSLGDALRAGGVAPELGRHAEVTIRPLSDIPEWPALFDILVGQYRGERLVAEVQVGAEFINGEIPPGVRQPDIRRTRTFGRVKVGGGVRTRIHIGHPVSATGDYAAEARPTLTLIDMSGTRRVARETAAIPPHGGIVIDVQDFFPEAGEILGGTGAGTLRVRDTSARLYGYYLAETHGRQTFPLCHLIGG